MKIEIDQSGKIEQTNKNTILCLSNDHWDAIIIKSKTKRQLQEIFRRNGQIRNFVLFTFSAALAILLKRHLKTGKVVIDREYFGKEAIIKEIVLEILTDGKNIPQISFASIGKLSGAHILAKEIALGKKKSPIILGEKELLKAIKKTEVGKRLKNA